MPSEIEEKLIKLESILAFQQCQIEVLVGFVLSKLSREDFEEYIQFVVSSDQFSESSKSFAREWTRQQSLWPDHDGLKPQ